MLKHNPLFLLTFLVAATYTLFSVEAVFCWRQYKNTGTQVLWITDSKTVLDTLSQNTHFQQKMSFWFSVVPAETPIFVVFMLSYQSKKVTFSQNRSCRQKCPILHLPNTNRDVHFSKKRPILTKSTFLHPPKARFLLAFACNSPFSIFFFLLSFSYVTKRKTKMPFPVRKPYFWHPENFCENAILAPLRTICDFKHAQKTTKLGKISKTNLGRDIDF